MTALAFARAARADGGGRRIVVQPMGPGLSDGEIEYVVRSLRGFYDAEIVQAAMIPLPKVALYPPRGRWRAEKLLAFLDAHVPEGASRVLGVTAADISTTKAPYEDWGVLGLAGIDAPSAVISSLRCKRRARGPEHATERFGKTAVHEIGHTYGLQHCASQGCLLEDAQGSVLTTDGEHDLCPACIAALGEVVRRSRVIPWAAPP